LIFQTDNLIIAHFAGPDQVTPYSVAYRLFGYTSLLQVLIFPNLWPAYTEAIARHDVAWVRRTFRANSVFGTALTLVLAVPLVLYGIEIIRVWAGAAAIPPFALMVWMALWSVTLTLMTAVSCLQSAAGRIKNQMYYAMSTAVVTIALSVWWVGPFGITGVIAATVIAYAICNNVPALIDVTFLLRRLQHDVQRVRTREELVREGEAARQV
jgi:O-antigen/teichoic acid export membrane protein